MWRRFRPKKAPKVVLPDGHRLATVFSVEDADEFAGQLKQVQAAPGQVHDAELIRNRLLAQTPRAVLAQIQMDGHEHGYHNREKRLYELIDFNDTFVSLVLATPYAQLPGFADRLKRDMTAFCGRLKTPMFSDEQFDAIARGLAREIAVYRAARYLGFDAYMTSRTEDAFGIDLVITHPDTKKVLNVDCKTPPSFRHRMEDLLHHGRISEDQLLQGDQDGFITVMQHRGKESVPVTLVSILPDTLGEIHDFTFDQPRRLGDLLNTIFTTIE
jgi:hypothetical protein